MKLFVESAAVLAPGLAGWAASREILAGEKPYVAAPLAPLIADLLPPVERRRTGSTVKMALSVGKEALTQAGRPVDTVATVFASSGNDGDVINDILITLAGEERQVSPTRFHNSVHNAPSGYWGIATRSHCPSTSLCAFDWSFAIGLLEAATQLHADQPEVLLIAYDMPYPMPFGAIRRVEQPFGAALLLARRRSERSMAALELTLDGTPSAISRMQDAGLEQLRAGNPSARALPLLAALTGAQPCRVSLERSPVRTLTLAVTPAG